MSRQLPGAAHVAACCCADLALTYATCHQHKPINRPPGLMIKKETTGVSSRTETILPDFIFQLEIHFQVPMSTCIFFTFKSPRLCLWNANQIFSTQFLPGLSQLYRVDVHSTNQQETSSQKIMIKSLPLFLSHATPVSPVAIELLQSDHTIDLITAILQPLSHCRGSPQK